MKKEKLLTQMMEKFRSRRRWIQGPNQVQWLFIPPDSGTSQWNLPLWYDWQHFLANSCRVKIKILSSSKEKSSKWFFCLFVFGNLETHAHSFISHSDQESWPKLSYILISGIRSKVPSPEKRKQRCKRGVPREVSGMSVSEPSYNRCSGQKTENQVSRLHCMWPWAN